METKINKNLLTENSIYLKNFFLDLECNYIFFKNNSLFIYKHSETFKELANNLLSLKLSTNKCGNKITEAIIAKYLKIIKEYYLMFDNDCVIDKINVIEKCVK